MEQPYRLCGLRYDVWRGHGGTVPEGAGRFYHQPEPVQRPRGRKNPVWYILNFVIRRYLCLTDAVIVPDYAPPDTVSEYNLFIPDHERNHYHFTGPFLDVDLSRYHFSQETIFTSFGGEPYKLPLYHLLRKIADERKDLMFDVFYTGASPSGII